MHFEIFPVAYASVGTLMKSIDKVILNPLIILLFAVALAYFLFGVAQFLMNASNEEMKKTGKSHMLWGIIGMTIMVCTFGIMQIIINTLGTDTGIKIENNGNYTVEVKK